MSAIGKVAIIGFGEAAQAFVEGWRTLLPAHTRCHDLKFDTEAGALLRDRCAAAGMVCAKNHRDAVSEADTIFSLVTADQAKPALQAAQSGLKAGALYLELNSCAPTTKEENAELAAKVGAHLVDVAIMAPVSTKKHRTPLLLSGPNATDALTRLTALDMQGRCVGETVGRAAFVKMIRSVMIKGLEAVTAECVVAGVRAGVLDDVIDALDGSDPQMEWRRRAAYNLERMASHGTRRAAEMREVEKTLESLGASSGVTQAARLWHERIGALQHITEDATDLQRIADAIAKALDAPSGDKT